MDAHSYVTGLQHDHANPHTARVCVLKCFMDCVGIIIELCVFHAYVRTSAMFVGNHPCTQSILPEGCKHKGGSTAINANQPPLALAS